MQEIKLLTESRVGMPGGIFAQFGRVFGFPSLRSAAHVPGVWKIIQNHGTLSRHLKITCSCYTLSCHAEVANHKERWRFRSPEISSSTKIRRMILSFSHERLIIINNVWKSKRSLILTGSTISPLLTKQSLLSCTLSKSGQLTSDCSRLLKGCLVYRLITSKYIGDLCTLCSIYNIVLFR